MNKKKIFNDPIYGLIRFPFESIYKLIDHPYFQRLRRISQQALSHYVYPGALHTRFHHALGATYLMTRAIETLKSKGVLISDDEYEAVCIAILLHDVGHGPFSHALEHILMDAHHEKLSLIIMKKMSVELKMDFSKVFEIYTGTYHRPFLHQLVSGQLDTDRMDYLTRDSFYSGVAEGIIGYDRIITMMDVVDNQLIIEEKGIYSIEKFIMARQLMYWQVYLHKTVVAAEVMLISVLQRARFLTQHQIPVAASPSLLYFLKLDNQKGIQLSDDELTDQYVLLDDIDILWMIKQSVQHEDFVFRKLCSDLLNRKLFKVMKGDSADNMQKFNEARDLFSIQFRLNPMETSYFFHEKDEYIKSYETGNNEIKILLKSGMILPYSHFNHSLIKTAERDKYLLYCNELGEN